MTTGKTCAHGLLAGCTLLLVGCPHPGAVPEDWWDTGAPPASGVDAGRVDTGVIDADLVDAIATDGEGADHALVDGGGPASDTAGADHSSTTTDAGAATDAEVNLDTGATPDSATAADAGSPVDSGATGDAGGGGDTGFQHPGNWVVPSEHGAALLQGTLDCTACHGADLTGAGDAPNCDSCHSLFDPGWRTSCVFCHGGSDNQTGAPPHDLSHNVLISEPGVGAHSEHLGQSTHQAVACGDCHLVPAVLTSPGHFLDSTPGQAEVALAGLGAGGSFEGTGCSAVYCHGNGQLPGSVADFTTFIDSCTACHPTSSSTPTAQATMSGDHARHLARGASCADCHAQVVDGSASFVGPTLHVNGVADVEVTTGSYARDTGNCATTCHSGGAVRNWTAGAAHPTGWSGPASHGPALLDATLDCTACHGADLGGGSSGISCDSCHAGGAAWRTDCTFCHGGTDSATGAPPADLAGSDNVAARSVGAHTEHLQGIDHAAVSCAECHVVPADVLTTGHLLDATPGQAEVDLASASGISGGSYAAGACAATYCHGDGQVIGPSPLHEAAADLGCSACHNGPEGGNSAAMSGRHATHLGRGARCTDCHGAVIDGSNQITGDALHVDGNRDVQLATGFYDEASGDCTTTCHTSGNPKNWTTGSAHPVDWAQESQHGVATVEGTLDCTACHGADLQGGSTGVSCDDCHTGGTAAWRTDCTFCHGGTDNATGAPPLDLHDATARSARAVGAHTEHVTQTTHPAYACSECHHTPVDVLSSGHLFDATPGQAELVFDSLGAGATLSDVASATLGATTTSCSNVYCHGSERLDNGTVASFTSTISTCDACHPFMTSSADAWQNDMSGQHKKHLDTGEIHCWECHGAVLVHDATNAVAAPTLHVNGAANVQLLSGSFTPATGRCSSVDCHGKDHGLTRTW